MDRTSAVLSTGAGKVWVHTGVDLVAPLDDGDEVIQGDLSRVLVQAAAAVHTAGDLDETGLCQLLCDLIGKLLGDELLLGDITYGAFLSVHQVLQNTQGVIGFPGNEHDCHLLLFDEAILAKWI